MSLYQSILFTFLKAYGKARNYNHAEDFNFKIDWNIWAVVIIDKEEKRVSFPVDGVVLTNFVDEVTKELKVGNKASVVDSEKLEKELDVA
jgi:hypothetical protein